MTETRRYVIVSILSMLTAATTWAQGGGPIAWWEAEGDALDSVGTNHGEMIGGATFGDGAWGQGFQFDGSGDYVRVPDSVAFGLEDAVTVAFWLRYEACTHAQGWCNLVNKSQSGWVRDHHFGVAIQASTGAISMFVGGGGNACFDYGGPDLRDGRWHHVAASYDEATMVHFVDGQQTHSVSCSIPLTTNGDMVEIGAESGEPGLAELTGNIDDVMLFDYALSEPEVLALTVMFEDGFDGGDTAAWSSTQP